ncbi:MAG TPA: DoxX family protein [Allosphingosinicella sp.]|nr:DoxX family protein [Allosphingosinicella sp.]
MNWNRLQLWAPRMLAVLRIVAGLIFLEHGTQKLLGWPPGDYAGIPLDSMPAYAGVIELVAGLLITIGLFTRPAAFVASGTMAVAYWMAHAPQNPFPLNNGGDAAILYCFVFLYLVFAGAGPWSVDALRERRETAVT